MKLWKKPVSRRHIQIWGLALVVILLTISTFTLSHSAVAKPRLSFTPPNSVTVTMYRLDYSRGGSSTGIPCTFDPPDTEWGCTWFDEAHFPQDIRPYPYPDNPVTVPIETDYVLDVLSQEMGPASLCVTMCETMISDKLV